MSVVVGRASAAAAVAALASLAVSRPRVGRALAAGALAGVAALLCQVLSLKALLGGRDKFPLEKWVDQREEDAVEPELAIFDPHHHLWDVRTQDKGWPVPKAVLKLLYKLKPDLLHAFFVMDTKRQGLPVTATFGSRFPQPIPYMEEELLADFRGNGRGHKVVGTVYVESGWKTPGAEPECMLPVAEAAMVTEVNRRCPQVCQGIVVYADLRLGSAVAPALDAYAKNPLVRGIRHSLSHSDDKGVIGCGVADSSTAFDAKFREGFALLAKYGFTYECWLFHEQIKGLAALAHSFPETTVICNHAGQPLGLSSYNRQKSFAEWKELLKELAAEKNVMMKIGGLGMATLGFGFSERPLPPSSDELAEAWAPYVNHCIDSFGVDRCMMESNFPVDKISCSYTTLFNALKKIVKDRPLEEKRKLFELNAKRIYRI